jgi:hypothetical protein
MNARMTKAISAVRKMPTGMLPGRQLSKLGLPPALPMRARTMAVKLLTTSANEVAMMNATASSTRFPRMMKSLKPRIGSPSRLDVSSALGCQLGHGIAALPS